MSRDFTDSQNTIKFHPKSFPSQPLAGTHEFDSIIDVKEVIVPTNYNNADEYSENNNFKNKKNGLLSPKSHHLHLRQF